PRQVATRPGEARDKTMSDRVVADDEHDGDRRSCGFGCERRRRTSRRCDHRDPAANQIGRQTRQPIQLVVRKAIIDRYVLALGIAGLCEPLAESAETVVSERLT